MKIILVRNFATSLELRQMEFALVFGIDITLTECNYE
jgi:hypothetical protein